MALFQTLTVGVAALQSQSSKLGVISDNISNVNTVGYKGSEASFKTLVNDYSVVGSYAAGGVSPGYQQTIQKQGLISASTAPTHLAISGRGFFAVGDSANGGSFFYTRAGSFNKNQNGDYLNSSGYFLKGWRLDENGDLPASLSGSNIGQSAAQTALETVNVDKLSLASVATNLIALQANLKASQTGLANNNISFVGNLTSAQLALPTTSVDITAKLKTTETIASILGGYDPLDPTKNMASGTIPANYTVPLTLYDASGAAKTVNVGYLKTAANSWAVEIYASPASAITPATGNPAGLIASGNLTFNVDGTLATISPALAAATPINWTTPVSTSTITFNFGTVGTANGVQQATNNYTSTFGLKTAYNPAIAASSMSGGGVTPHYTSLLTLTDNSGTTRNVAINFVKTAANSWGVEITAQPVGSITPPVGGVPGQIAYGTATFNADGSLASISPALSSAIAVNWTGATEINSIQVNWGTLDNTNGLKQVAAAYSSVPTTVKNYDPTNITKNMTSGSVVSHFNRSIDIVDNTGKLKTLNFMFLKTNANTWAVEIATKNASDVTLPTAQLAHGIVSFNGDGTLASITPSLSAPLTIPWAVGAPSVINLDLGTAGPIAGTVGATVVGLSDGLSQLDTNFQVKKATHNGNVAGEIADVTVDDTGFVIGRYSNGTERKLYKIPLAQFLSPDKLESISGNVFLQTQGSGGATYFQASQLEKTSIAAGALESSNVELSDELTNMIIAQRAYQSNSKLITTSDSMLDTITKL